MAAIRARGHLVAGVDQNTKLLAFLDPGDAQLHGLEIDILRQVAKAIFGDPNAVEFRAITTAQRLDVVREGTVDIVADAVTVTCERRRKVDFSSVYFDAHQGVLVPSSSPARSIADLAGQRVCATRASTSIENVARYPRLIPYPVAQRTDCLVALQQGGAEAIASDDAILRGFQAQDPYTKILVDPAAPAPYGMAISKAHPDLVRFVNGVLARIRTDGTWRQIYARWFGSPAPAPPVARYAR
jgi:polar amino acid transport system substrate-binding protein